MAAKYRVISLLMITILLLANSGSMWKISPTEERSRKIPDMYPVKGAPSCSTKCSTGLKFSCMANCRTCVPCSHCRQCNCTCVKNEEPCTNMRSHICGNMLKLKCQSYSNGCFCYCEWVGAMQ
ncbi:uncharacterized protein LOC142587849 isoform X2 [Dermacentor variabilis]|uniref:uncharacterized protein LOC142587849 isoform X2 n=1 Tax=Dermacentor variabilis TaxID=34621 RepID=UPI003F5C60DC